MNTLNTTYQGKFTRIRFRDTSPRIERFKIMGEYIVPVRVRDNSLVIRKPQLN